MQDTVIAIVAILAVFGTPVMIVAIICFTSMKGKKGSQNPEDAKMIQEIYRGLEKMELYWFSGNRTKALSFLENYGSIFCRFNRRSSRA